MAVTKIRKISSWTLWAVSAISVVVFGLFYLGGQTENSPFLAKGITNDPKYTAELLYWGYTVVALAVITLIGFGAFQFTTSLMTSPKKALTSLSVIAVFLVLLGITYAMGDGTPLPNINAESAQYNIPFWLKVTEMWLYTAYVLGTLCVLAVLSSSVMKFIRK
jgi:hypothetical protein